MFKKGIIVVVLLACVCYCRAQQWVTRTIPELQKIVRQGHADTGTAHAMIDLGAIYVLRPGIVKNDLDSCLLMATAAIALSKKIRSLKWEAMGELLLANAYREEGPPEDTALSNKAIALAKDAYDRLIKAHLNGDAGYAALELTNYMPTDSEEHLQQKITALEKALALLKQTFNEKRIGAVYQQLGDFYAQQASFEKALVACHHALEHFKIAGYKEVQGVYDLMSGIYGEMSDSKQAIRYGTMAAQTAEAVGDSTCQLSAIYNHLGIAYFQISQFPEAIKQFRKALPMAERLADTVTLRFLLGNIANSYMRSDKPAEALSVIKTVERRYPPESLEEKTLLNGYFVRVYLRLHRENEAVPYIRNIELLSAKMTDLGKRQTHVNNVLMTYYFATGEYAKASEYNMAEQLLDKLNNDRRSLMESYKQQFRIDSAQKRYLSAINHYQQYSALKDSLFSDANARQKDQLEEQFQAEKKDHEQKLKGQGIQLLSKQAQLQQAKIKQAHFTLYVIIGSELLLLLLLVLGYNRYQIKRKSKHQLAHKQSEINRQHSALQELMVEQEKLLGEKEWLMKEIHHRVKNNLQIVISLLNTQSAYITDDKAFNAIRESRHRMQAMSLIHQKLYQEENVSKIDMPAYLQDLTDYLKDSFNTHRNIYFHIKVQPIKLDVSQAVPVGLILNEAVTNAIKYAFNKGSGAEVFITLEDLGNDQVKLVVWDNGSGVPASYDLLQSGSFGMELMTTLTTQLAGNLHIDTSDGVKIALIFTRLLRQAVSDEMPVKEA